MNCCWILLLLLFGCGNNSGMSGGCGCQNTCSNARVHKHDDCDSCGEREERDSYSRREKECDRNGDSRWTPYMTNSGHDHHDHDSHDGCGCGCNN